MAKLLASPTKNAVQKTLAAQLLSTAGAGDPITFDDVDGIPNLPGVLVIRRVDNTGVATPSFREYIEYSGTSGTTVLITTRNVDGSNSALTHPVGSIVEFIPDVTWADRIYDSLATLVDVDDISTTKATLLSGTQTITGAKTFDTAITGKQIATPSNPASGYNKIYFKSDNKAYTLTSAGVETEVGSGSGAETEVFIIAGTFPSAATTNLSKTWFAPANLTISKVDLYVSTAGSGTGSTVVDINKNGTTICASTKLTLTTTETSDVDVTPSTTAVTKGDAITIDVDSVTATTAPTDGYVLIHYTRD